MVIDFTYCRGKKNELVPREVGIVDLNLERLQSFNFLPPYSFVNLKEQPPFSPGAQWNGGYIPFSDMPKLLDHMTSQALALFGYGKEKCEYLENLLDRTVIDITQGVECPPPDAMGFSGQTCILPEHLPLAAECAIRQVTRIAQFIQGNHASYLTRPNTLL